MAETQTDTEISKLNSCKDSPIDYANDPNLTQQEKTILMDQALQRSLNAYGECQDNLSNTAHAASNAENSHSEGSSSASNGGSTSSTASSQMTGTEEAASSTPVDHADSKMQNPLNSRSEAPLNEWADKSKQHNRLKGSGKTPGDIPPTDNDSVLEAQIRQAAIAETNPTIKARLWNEYRKYKGLPAKNTSKGNAAL